jgi:membrane protein
MDPAAILERFLDEPRVAYVRAILDTYGRAAGGLLANGLAFAALFATIPTMLVVLGLAGLMVGDPDAQAKLATALKDAFPPLSELIDGALAALASGAAFTSVVGLIGLVWTVSQLYVTLDVAFSRIFHGSPERDPIRRMARGFAWVAALLATVVVTVVLGSLAAAANALLPGGFPIGAVVAGAATSLPALILLGIAVVLVIYRWLPPGKPAWRSIWLPAVVAATVIVLLSQAFVFLAPRLVGVAALVGSLATAFIALAWLSFSFQALLYGAAWVRVRDIRRRGDRPGSALGSPAATTESGGGGE